MSELTKMPRSQREQLVRSLLAEFNAQRVALFGSEMHHSCVLPFGLHPNGDRNPSASINIDSMVMSCFVCGGGGLLWWVATCRGEPTSLSTQWLASRNTFDGLADLLAYFDSLGVHERPEQIPTYSTSVLKPWLFVHPYMTEIRRIPVEVCKRFRVGYDAQRERIVIPHFWQEKLVGWQSRRLANDRSPKYLSSPDFPKKWTTFNHTPGEVVVVESPMSVLSRFARYPQIEATFGASVTDPQVRILARHPRVTLFFDPDPAGVKATYSVGERLLAHTDVRVVDNPWDADAADLTDEDFAHLVSSAVPFAIWNPREVEKYAGAAP